MLLWLTFKRRSVVVATAIQLVCLNRFTGSQPLIWFVLHICIYMCVWIRFRITLWGRAHQVAILADHGVNVLVTGICLLPCGSTLTLCILLWLARRWRLHNGSCPNMCRGAITPSFAPSNCSWSSGGRLVELLACGARGQGFDSPPRHLNFQRLVISCFQVEIWLKDG